MLKRGVYFVIFIATIFFVSGAMAADLTAMESLGKKLYNDTNLSLNFNQSCQTCHHQSAKFADPENTKDPLVMPVSDGSDPALFGGRNAPTAAYAGFSPVLTCEIVDKELFCFGGMFWDGRATGLEATDTGGIIVGGEITGPTYDPLSDQAKGPFQNPIEMALTPDQVIERVRAGNYEQAFKNAFGPEYDLFTKPDHVLYNDIAIAIAEFEESADLNKFSSKFDRFAEESKINLSGVVFGADGTIVDENGKFIEYNSEWLFSEKELRGLALFNSPNDNNGVLDLNEGGNCAACHPSGPITDPTDSQGQILFTDFTYDNLGVPVNPTAYALHYGSDNPDDWDTDLGLYTTLTGLLGYKKNQAKGTKGLFRVSTLRNIARTAPYSHNGFFATLTDIVNFYNTRDLPEAGWPEAEVPETVNLDELGNLGLSSEGPDNDVAALVAFMNTLTD